MKRLSCLAAILLMGLCAAVQAEPAPTSDELHQLYDAGSYKELIPKISKALSVKGPDAAQYDRYDLLSLKGEASLHTHAKQSAVDAFKQAAAAAAKPQDAALAQATAELIRQSNGALKYLPRTKATTNDKPDPIDIVDSDSRKKALQALETDMAAKVKLKVDPAAKGNSLTDILNVVKSKDLSDLKLIELAASGSTPDTTQMIGDLGARASSLMDDALDKMTDQMKADVDSVNHRNNPAPAKPGEAPAITTIAQFEQAMTNIHDSAKQIGDYAGSMKGLFGDGTDLKPIQLKSTEVQGEATRLLKQAKNAGG
jgi:hypothetical protein